MTFLDFFAGIGGFRRGLEVAGHKCLGFCEWDRFAVASYTSMHCITDEQREYLSTLDLKQRQKEILKDEYRNGEWYAADIRSVDARSLPRADCWCFGFPCQDISVAGKQAGFRGNRSSLFFATTKLIRDLEEKDRPELLLIENVKNLLSVNRGFDFARLLIELDEIGYDAEWQVLNSKDFGVPQNRERVFIIGHLRGRSTTKVFPLEGSSGENRVQKIGHKRCYQENTMVYSPSGISGAINAFNGGGNESHVAVSVLGNINPSGNGMNGNIYGAKGLSPAETTNKGEGNKIAVPVLTPDRENKRQNGRRFKENGDDMFTLTGQDRHGVALKVKNATKDGYTEAHEGDSINLEMPDSKTRRGRVGEQSANTLDTGCNQGIMVKVEGDYEVYAVWSEEYQCYIAIRKLTPRECFRLQGWTDDYFDKAQFVNSDSQLYKQAGNSVTVNVIEAIGERIDG